VSKKGGLIVMNHNNMSRLLEKMSHQERAEVEAFAAFLIARRSLQHAQLLTNDIPIQELMELVLRGGGFDWLNSEDEDIYSIEDGEEVTWGNS